MAPSGPGERRAAVREHLDELYDFALTVTWDPTAAAEAVASAVTRLGDRAPDRAVLLALTRLESLVRARPAEAVGVDPAAEPPPLAPDEAELQALALSVLAGLAPHERATLDLALRRNLEAHDLAAALDVPSDAVGAAVADARDRADRLLGHYVLARVGTRHCTALATAVDAAPEGLVPLADHVDRHLAECEQCAARRAGLAPATTFLPSIPDRPAPPALQDALFRRPSIFRRLVHGAEADQPRRWRRVVGIGGLVALVAAALLVGALVVRDESSDEPALEAAPAAVLTGTPRAVDFGAEEGSATVALHNTSEEAVAWTSVVDVPWLTVEPAEGRLPPGGAVEINLTLDRTGAPEGEIVTTARFEGTEVAAEVEVTAQVAQPPAIVDFNVDPAEVSMAPCEGGATTATGAATVTDGSGIASAVVRWTLPDGTTGESAMQAQGNRWRGALGPFESEGPATWTVVATDETGQTTESEPQSLPVNPECVVPEDAGT